ncbi:hypothetical protein D3C76_1019840 [compost metagenome]|uniref:hypothetical protein n=1 Tax=unclassified Pseudomonas TaxID=196821 RepID=UPI000FBE4F54|nr:MULTISPECIES: hypothetical protein [unclassified Pseudomonas]MBV7524451.1 hypothetical protein [Pseudomonas sp. PDM29]
MSIKIEVDSYDRPSFSGEMSGELEVSISKNGGVAEKIKTSRAYFYIINDFFQLHFYFADFPTTGVAFLGRKDQWVGSHELKKSDNSLMGVLARFTEFGGSWSADDRGEGKFVVDKFYSDEEVQEIAGKFDFSYKSEDGSLVEVISPRFWAKRNIN